MEQQFGHLREANYKRVPGIVRPAAALMGVSYSALQEYIRLQTSPYSGTDGKLKTNAAKIAAALSLDPSEAFPPELYAGIFTSRTKDIAPTQILSLGTREARMIPGDSDKDPLSLLEAKEERQQFRELLHQLSPREEKVLSMYFGLNGEDECGLEEIGMELAVTKERVRQIKEQALAKLAHSLRLKPLQEMAERRARAVAT